MKKQTWCAATLLLMALALSGCHGVGEKAASQSIIYGAAAVISLLLLVGCCLLVKEKRRWFLLLFASVLVVNIGYTFLSLSTGLDMALMANRVAYLGSVFLPVAMLMIILNATNTKIGKWLPTFSFGLALVVFFIAASPGILDIYYKEVSFQIVNGVATLVKVYGPLHPLYLVYLLGCFVAMVAVIIRAAVKKTIDTTAHAVILTIAVFVNLGVWFIEQMSDIDFEFLSVSYIISELFLLGVHLVMNENRRLKELVLQKQEALLTSQGIGEQENARNISAEMIQCFIRGLDTLTPTERAIYDAYLDGKKTKDVMFQLNIKENTVKFHNKNLYSKLGVSSRKELLAVSQAVMTNGK